MTFEQSVWMSFEFAMGSIGVLAAIGVAAAVWYKLGDRDDQPTKR